MVELLKTETSEKIPEFPNELTENWLSELMDLYSQEIIWLVYSYVRDASISEDITQEVFIKCYQSIDTFRSDSSIKTWLFRIAINTCKDYLRSAYVRRMTPTHIISKFYKSNAPSPETITLSNNDSKVLTEKVLALPKKYREIIMLYYFQELKMKEIADVLGINENTVKTRLRKAKQILKEKLDDGSGGASNGK